MHSYVLIGFYIEFSGVEEKESTLIEIINSSVRKHHLGKWKIEEEWRPERSAGDGLDIGYLIYPSGLKTRDGSEAWNEAEVLEDEIVASLALGKDQIRVEPYTDLGFSPELEDRRLAEKAPGAKGKNEAYDPGTKYSKWSVKQIRALDAHSQFNVSGNEVRVGLMDTGHTQHKEIISEGKLNLELGWNTYEGNDDTRDPMKSKFKLSEPVRLPGHGTSTASILTSQIKTKGKTTTDIVGVSPGAEIVPYRIGNSQMLTSKRLRKSVAKAIVIAQDENCEVLSLSLGHIAGHVALRKAIDDAKEKGMIIVAAAGQVLPFLSAPKWLVAKPAAYRNTIAVAACDVEKKPCKWSFRGEWVDVMAPGEGVWRAFWNKNKRAIGKRSWGTSYATPHVAGIAALWLERWDEDLKAVAKRNRNDLFRFVLQHCGLDAKGKDWGAGIIDAVKVLSFPWNENDQWEQYCKSLPLLPDQYTWQEELSLDMYDASPSLIQFNEFASGTEATLLESLTVESNEIEDFLDENYTELVFHLRSDKNDRQIFLSRLARNLDASPESVGLSEPALVKEGVGGPGFLENTSLRIKSRVAK